MSTLKISSTPSQPDFARTIRSRGHRLTPQRHTILEAVRKADRHLTPDEVYARAHAKNPAISRATIYRTLDFLCEMRLVTALQWGGQMYYEAAGEAPHHHLVCRNCGGIQQIDHSVLDPLYIAVDKKYHFSIDMDHLGLFGLCAGCRKKQRNTL
jgi:Fur family transcriptional regulator, ferric uptake regulator